MPSFMLRVSFDGLCLFAPRLAQAEPRLHVLLVNGGTDPHHAHVPALYVDSSYLLPGRLEESGHVFRIPLDGVTLSFEKLGGPALGATVAFGQQIIALPDVSPVNRVPDTLLKGPLDPRVAARVTFSTGVPESNAGTQAVWDVHPTKSGVAPFKRTLDDWTAWRIPTIDGDRLTLTLAKVGANPASTKTETRTLFPVRGQIRLHVYCSPAEDLPGGAIPVPPKAGDPATHFPMFYALFDNKPAAATLTLAQEGGKSTETTRCVSAQA